jgi:histidyl-tRNA synthetase
VSRAEYRSGFPEYLPSQRAVELAALDALRRTFELHGFASIETSSVEELERLLQKGETDKEIYVLRRLHAEESADSSGLGLHFDLTVPLARYVVANAGRLEFPFRRYQIQRCWRGERPQEGRYREFTQADIDVVGKDALSFDADVEIASVMAEALSALPVPRLRLQMNNRRLMEGFFLGVGATDTGAAMRAVDKLDKTDSDQVRQLLVGEAGLSADAADRCLALAGIATADTSFVQAVRDLGVAHPLLDQGLDELESVMAATLDAATARVEVVADLRIARGLDYYTGTVFETRMLGWEGIGSVCSGGRYDALATDGRTTYPGVGISLGVTRMLAPLILAGRLDGSRSVPSAVLVALPDDASRPASRAVAQQLRARRIPTEVAPEPTKYGRQIRHAERRGIPYVWFPQADGSHEVRDIRSGDQRAADPTTWSPPATDLYPSIVYEEFPE